MSEVRPEDSASQSGKSSTVSSSRRVRALAKSAALAAEMEALKFRQELELEEVKLKQKKAALEMQTKLKVMEAEGLVYSQFEEGSKASKITSNVITFKASSDKTEVNGTRTEGHVFKADGGQESTLQYPRESLSKQSFKIDVPSEVHVAQPPVSTPKDDSWQIKNRLDTEILRHLQLGQVNQQQLLESINLPNAELMKFDGNPLKYYEFVQSFDCMVGDTMLQSSGKLMRLFNSCEGAARKVIQSCMMLMPDQGYLRARELLEERFGNNYKIGEAWMRRVTDGPAITNSSKQLREYADDLQSCTETLRALGIVQEMSSQRELVKIIERLPFHLRSRWLREVKRIRDDSRRPPNIYDVVIYVNAAAEEMSDPVYGSLIQGGSRDSRSGKTKEKTSSSTLHWQQSPKSNFSSSLNPQKCMLCDNDHVLFSCQQFKSMNPEQRLQYARDQKLCFNCLKPGHMSSKCLLNRTCSVKGCTMKHTKFLHTGKPLKFSEHKNPSMKSERVKSQSHSTTQTEDGAPFEALSSHTSSEVMGAGNYRVALPIVPVKVRAADGDTVVETFALLDSGSTNSFCVKELQDVLQTKGRSKILSVSTLEKENSQMRCQVLKLKVTGLTSDRELDVKAYTRPNLNISISNMATEVEITNSPHLRDLDLPEISRSQVTILIGQDVPEALMPLEVKAGKPGEIYAVRTVLGWTLNGPLRGKEAQGKESVHVSSSFISDTSNAGLEEQVKRFWKLEGMEYLHDDNRGMSINDKAVLGIWKKEINMHNGHYQLPIPFRDENVHLPQNLLMAERRLESLRRKLSTDEYLLDKYREGMSSLLEKGYAEEIGVRTEAQNAENQANWYLPHHPVINPKKPGKVRIVYDCAAKYKGICLNDVVHQGPDLTNKLAGVLLRFRRDPIALTADIEAMFHQVQVPPFQRDVLRFLWWPSGDLSVQPHIYRMCVHLFGGTWSPSACSFALRQTADDNEQDFGPETVKTVRQNFYVNDCLVSTQSDDKAIKLAVELRELLRRGGFKLTKWMSNSPTVVKSIPVEERAKELTGVDLNHDALPIDRALGISWNVESDSLGYKILPKDKPFTRRGLLSVVSSMYDPLGFASPFVVRGKMILQELCRKGLAWDDPIPEVDKQKWLKWISELPDIEQFDVNRCMRPHEFPEPVNYELHHFSDASEAAYGVASYLVLETRDGQIHSELVMSKSHLAPIKKTTIPRLELSAAAMNVKVDAFLRRELNIPVSSSHFWTDSTIILGYIGNEEKRFRIFVANRIAAIRSYSTPEQWHYVDSKSNPADDLSRGLTAEELKAKQRWVHGPKFLLEGKGNWPTDPVEVRSLSECDPEVKMSKDASTFNTTADDENVLDKMIAHYSSWYKLKRAVCWMVKFLKWLKAKKRPLKLDVEGDSNRITFDEMTYAEQKIIQYEQSRFFREEIGLLTAHDGVKKSSSIYKLDPKLEGCLIRVGGRLSRSALPLEAKHPIVLPKGSSVSKLILREIHEKSGHSGRNFILSTLRERFWLPGAGAEIRKMMGRCVSCRRKRAKVMQQKMADLPKDRVTPDEPPFSRVGMDFFGPIEVKRGRSIVKRYGVIFTCLAIRAVHIEMSSSLDTDSCIDAIRRFIARRGNVKEIRSDNGTNLVGAEREMRQKIEGWNQAKVNNELLQRNIKWSFNPPGASHFGGIWERQIGTVRKLILALTKQQTLSDESLSTLLCEVESIINNRPITRLSDDANDVEALTPNHLLLLNRKPQLPPIMSDKSDVYARRRWRQVQYMADLFWRRWIKEYLPQLQEREKWVSSRPNVKVGDLVLVVNENVPRNLWQLGRVLKTMPDRRGFVRSVEVKTRNSVLVRPIAKLCLILEADV